MNNFYKTTYDSQIFEISENYVLVIFTKKKEIENFSRAVESDLVEKLSEFEAEQIKKIIGKAKPEQQKLF